MKVFLIAAVAVAVSGAAYAKDLKGSVMTDTEMDKVTAGEILCTVGCGTFTGNAASGGVLLSKTPVDPYTGPLPPFPAGAGTLTAGIVKQH